MSSALVTVTKSGPKNTPVTPPVAKIRRASGEDCAASSPGKSAVPTGSTVWPGRNFSVAGFGVDSVWMNMAVSGRLHLKCARRANESRFPGMFLR